MDWLMLLAQQTVQSLPQGDVTTAIISALGGGASGALAVLFALRWVQAIQATAEAEKRALLEKIAALQAEWAAYLKDKRQEDARLLEMVLQKGKAS